MPPIGVITRTLQRSPYIRKILVLEIGNPVQDAIAIIYDNRIQIYLITESGLLQPSVTKDDFDCKIVSAERLHVSSTEEILIKPEYGAAPLAAYNVIVVVLEHAELCILSFSDSDGLITIGSRHVPLPSSLNPLEQVGKHLAVDPAGHAIAVAAQDNIVMLLSPDGSGARILQVQGTIHDIIFLHPPKDDHGHIVLVALLVVERKVLLQRIDWVDTAGIPSAQIHPPQRIASGKIAPIMLVL